MCSEGTYRNKLTSLCLSDGGSVVYYAVRLIQAKHNKPFCLPPCATHSALKTFVVAKQRQNTHVPP